MERRLPDLCASLKLQQQYSPLEDGICLMEQRALISPTR